MSPPAGSIARSPCGNLNVAGLPSSSYGRACGLEPGGAVVYVSLRMPDVVDISPEAGPVLIHWFEAHRRDLPWREHYDSYQVLVAEFMGQQTQMDRVVAYFQRFVERFPDIETLARAHEEDVLKQWEGLGYYARARRLHAAAKTIADRDGGRVPDTLEGLLALPGVGPYTAAAVASQAFNIPAPAVDANAERVLARLLDLDIPVKRAAGRKALEAAVRRMTPNGAAREFNQALMELGALVCRPFNSECGSCPVRNYCKSLQAHTVDMRPKPIKKPTTIRINMVTGVLLREGRVYVQKRREDDVWPGLWEFPGGVIESGESEEQALAREFFEEVELRIRPIEKITKIRYSYTRYRVTLNAWRVEDLDPDRAPVLHEATQLRFLLPSQLAALAFPAGHRRLVDTLDRTVPAWWSGV